MVSNPQIWKWRSTMGSTQVVCLGYRCSCGTYVPVYRFTKVDGRWEADHPAMDVIADCPTCQAPRPIPVANIQSLERWTEDKAS
jgi:hypothetical protein